VPYRIDVDRPPPDALDRLVALGALDVEELHGGLAALMPDGVAPETIANLLALETVSVSPARSRDGGSVWLLSPRPVRVGGLLIAPAEAERAPGVLRLHDGVAFGTGCHPTTSLCLEVLADLIQHSRPARVLDVGTGSGVLALAALIQGVERAVALDIDREAAHDARANARLNDLEGRLDLVCGGPEAVSGAWPLVAANVLTAPLVDMAPALVRCVASGGRLVLSGIPSALAADVERAYQRVGMRPAGTAARSGWSALTLAPSW
jgi:ribosomal protein L11 methyltransferase